MSLLNCDRCFLNILRIGSLTSGFIVALIFLFVGVESWPALDDKPFKFFSDAVWNPADGEFNLTPMVVGSLAVTSLAIAIAVPISFLVATFYTGDSHPLIRKIVRTIIEIFNGIPSVLFGFWGLVAIVPQLYKVSPPGVNMLSASIVLTLMLIPTIAIFIGSAIEASPKEWRLGAHALGIDQRQFALRILLPGIKAQILTAVLIGVGRAIGETMAVLMVAGNIIKVPLSVFDPVRTLTSNIALEMAYAMDEHRAALFTSGLILLIVVSILSLITRYQDKKGLYAS